MSTQTQAPPAIVYPESDGKRMSDNTKQARWIVVLHGNLDALLPEAFVAMDLMWYAREGFPEESAAPDVFVAIGRPKGDRRSYKQWEEEDVSPQVVFEIVSPSNTGTEMDDKEAFYADHNVEEYYVYDPDKDYLSVYLRKGTVLRRKWFQNEFTSPLLGIRFDLTGPEMQVFYPDGRRFLTFAEVVAEHARETTLRQAAEQRATSAEQRATSAEQRAERLAELSRKLLLQQATAEEILELQQLLQPPAPS